MIIAGKRRVRYDAIAHGIARATTGFKALGISGETPVALMLRNDFAFFEASAAAAMLTKAQTYLPALYD
jgi:long-chain acyl-CoA synthetase